MTANGATGRGSQPARVDSDEEGRTVSEPSEITDLRIGSDRRRPLCAVVEDDVTMRHLVMNYLEEHDIRAVAASRRDEVSALLLRGELDLVILDLRLGQEDGDRVVGLELGADDYITKPFGLRELLARIRAVLRRREIGNSAAARDAEKGRCRFGGWLLDRRSRRLTNSRGELVGLTKGEYSLLVAFLDAPQRPLSREHLLQATRIHEDVFDRSIDVQVLRLRRKLESDPSTPSIIQTERGVGYIFSLPVEVL